MKKNGFTLVEVLTVIVILSLLIAIAIPSTIAVNKKIKSKMLTTKLELATKNALLWAKDNRRCFTSTDCSDILNYQVPITDLAKTVVNIRLGLLAASDFFKYDRVEIIENPVDKTKCLQNYLLEIIYDKTQDNFTAKTVVKPEAAPAPYYLCD